MAAATTAYVAWTFALPATPFAQETWYSAGLASFLILVVSAGLGLMLRYLAKDAKNRFQRCGDRAMSVHDGRGAKPLPEKEISREH
jgi:hypothetical protein